MADDYEQWLRAQIQNAAQLDETKLHRSYIYGRKTALEEALQEWQRITPKPPTKGSFQWDMEGHGDDCPTGCGERHTDEAGIQHDGDPS